MRHIQHVLLFAFLILITSNVTAQEAPTTLNNQTIQQEGRNQQGYPKKGEYGQDPPSSPKQKSTRSEGLPALTFDRTRARNLASWKPQMVQYSQRHYGEATSRLDPTCIVLHYTVSSGFPWNLVESNSFAGEAPGLAAHYVVQGEKIWEILPSNVRSRGCYGINHRAINIEMVALDARDLAARPSTLRTSRKLCKYLMIKHGIKKSHIYSHQQVATMDRRIVPEALDLVNGTPYHKIDPGRANMKTILNGL